MSRTFTPKVITGNHLLGGHSVWLTPDNHWTVRPEEAEVIADQALAELRMLHADSQGHEVVGAYLAEATPPIREQIRQSGPSARSLTGANG